MAWQNVRVRDLFEEGCVRKLLILGAALNFVISPKLRIVRKRTAYLYERIILGVLGLSFVNASTLFCILYIF